jgi:hypothetical protein
MNLKATTATLASVALCVTGMGCTGPGDRWRDPEIGHRGVSIFPVDWGNPSTEPLVLYVGLSVGIDPRIDGNRDLLESITKIEVDFGDSTGWLDATAWLTDYLTPPYDNTTAGMIKHIYPAAGTYTPNARATYWDGEVIYWNSQLDPNRQVTVPYSEEEHGHPWL